MKKPIKPKLHFIGIGGSGMCPLALYAKACAYQVSGSDSKKSSKTELLIKSGIPVHVGPANNTLLSKNNLVVLSSAIKENNTSLKLAKEKKLSIIHRSDLLNMFLKEKEHTVTVAGTHGKTSSSALLTYLLYRLEAKPSAVIGGKLQFNDKSWLKDDSSTFVIEADESDGSFLKYKPFIGILTNIDCDHLDYYKTQKNIEDAFQTYLSNINKQGFAIIGTDNKTCSKLFSDYTGNKLSFGFSRNCDFYASNIRYKNALVEFELTHKKTTYSCKLKFFGKHNILNALAALAAVSALGYCVEKAVELLPDFTGVERRLSILHESENLIMVDDYAHNPGKISACIEAVSNAWPKHQLIVLFQAHRYSRLETMFHDFSQAFFQAKTVVVLPVFSAGESVVEKFSQQFISQKISLNSSVKSLACASVEDVLKLIKKTADKKIAILSLGAGDINEFSQKLKEQLIDPVQQRR